MMKALIKFGEGMVLFLFPHPPAPSPEGRRGDTPMHFGKNRTDRDLVVGLNSDSPSPLRRWGWGMRSFENTNRLVFGSLFLIAFSILIVGCTKSPTPDAHQQHATLAEQKAEEYYTCPMHPSVRSDKPGACPVCGMALVKKTAQKNLNASDLNELQTVSLSPTQRVMANISVVKVGRRNVNRDVQAVGVVSFAEPNYKHISARFPGRLDKLYLNFTGQSVRKGEPVADVYSPEAISAQQEYLLALDSYEHAKQGEQSFASSAEQLLEQSKNKLLQWGFSERQIARLKDSRKVSSLVTIYSPISGVVVKKSVDPQHYVATGEDMFDVADLSTVWVLLDVYEKDLRFINKNQSVEISTEAYPFEKFKGRVMFIDPVVNPETRTVRVRTEFPNQHGKLKPNMYANATIQIPKKDALVVPSSAIVSTGKRMVVWVEVKPNTFQPREIMTTTSSDGYTIVIMGLEEGESVAETGGFLIDSESQLGSQF
jgi:Cu(I)/Ag(I) efflux system membrane fusion protein